MKYSVEIREEKRLREKITQPMTDSSIICRFLLDHQLNHLQNALLRLRRQRSKFLREFRRFIACRMLQDVTENRVCRNLKPIEKNDQFLTARKRHTTFNRRNIICSQPGLFRKLFLRDSEAFPAFFTRLPIRLSIIARTYTFSITLITIIWVRGIVIQKR